MKTTLLILLLASTSGCVTRTIKFPNGIEYSSQSFLTNPAIGPIKLTTSKDGYMDFSVGSYNHNQTEVAGIILELAAKGALVK